MRSIFLPVFTLKSKKTSDPGWKETNHKRKNINNLDLISKDIKFPPEPPSKVLLQKIIHGFSQAQIPSCIEEGGCAICGILWAQSQLLPIIDYKEKLHLLSDNGRIVTRKERKKQSDPISVIPGPILNIQSNVICTECAQSLQKDKPPNLALANGLWIGDVPPVLQNLTLAEQLLIARVRHNRCVVRVSSGMHKMRANAVMFANPTPKIY
ncbi:hypothetical protein NEOLEDRAFT_1069177, partial [Neolentinus lepideus HHB14362 ss-1]